MGGDGRFVALGEIVKLHSGNTPSKSNPDFWGGKHPWASAKDLKSFYLNSTIDGLTDLGISSAAKLASAGTTLILTRGMTLVNHVPICVTTTTTAFNQDVKAVVPKDKSVEPEFIPYLLLANERRIHSSVELAGHGTGKLPTENLLKLSVYLPCERIRKQIGELFKSLDDKIELNQAINRTLEAMAQAIFKSWFVDFDPVKAKMAARESGDDPTRAAMAVISGKSDAELDAFQQQDPKNYQRLHDTAQAFPDALVDSELGLIPAGWEVGTLGELCVLNGKSWTTKNAPSHVAYVDLANTKNGVIEEVQRYQWDDAPSRARRVLGAGDTIVGTVRPGNRSFALVGEGEQLTGSTGFAVLTPLKQEYVEFVYITATSDVNIDRLAQISNHR